MHSNLSKIFPDHVRSEMLHCHHGVAQGALEDIANSSSIDGLVGV